MDPSIFKLFEEDEDESMHSSDDVDAFQASLSREIEGENNSSSQHVATQSNAIGDANTNLHILESTQMKEQQRCVSGDQNQELKREYESHPQHNPPQDRRQPDQLWENPSHVPQASNLQPRNNPISNEPERPQPQCLKLQKTSSQRARGTEQPVDPVNHGPTEVQVCEFIRILIAQVNKDREKQLLALFYKFKRKEITKETFLRSVRSVVGDQMARLATSTLHPLEQGNKGIKVPGRPNHHRESFTSAEISAKKPDPRGVHVNQPTSTSSGTLSSSATVQGSHNFERTTSVNGSSGVQGGPMPHFQNNSSLPLYSAPCQGSVAKDQTAGPSSSAVHVKQISIDQSFDQAGKLCSLVQQDVSDVPMKQKNGNPKRSNDDLEKQSSKMVLSTSTTHASFVYPSVTKQLDSSTMVKSPAPSGTIPTGAHVRTTPKMPSAGQKKPLEALGSSQPPSSKRQKLRGTSKDRSIEKFNDVTALSGINIVEEENKLLSSGPKMDCHVSKASRRVVHEEEERTIFQKVPLQRKLTEIMAKSGVKHMNDDVERCLSLCVEERMRGLLSNIIRISKQRTDAEKGRNRTCITSDIGKQINEMNQKVKEEWDIKNGGEEKLKNGENDTAKKDNRSEQVKENKKEQDEKRAKAANVAALASIGGNDTFLKWKLMAEARQKPSSGTGRNIKKPSGETVGRIFVKSQGSPKVVRSISVKDVIAVVEREPQMSRYNRICSDVPTQEKT